MNNANQQAETLFDAARKLTDPAQRKAFLDAACTADPELRHRVEMLLAARTEADKFFAEGSAALNHDSEPVESPGQERKDGGTVRVTLPPEEQPGTRIGHYKLREKLGEGGCGVVYVAEQEEPVRRRVALKVIKQGMDTRQVIARFEAERQALAMMDHPNIAKVLDAGTTENGRPYFVMELVRGIRITDYCDQNHLDTNQRLELFIQVCKAVQHAHQKGIIHRDLKPSNILVTLHDGVPVPKVIDFGIAKATEGRLTDLTVYTALHQFIGTPAYMSPEQAEMSGLDIDTRSDIYSLGVLLYELLTGDTPFDAKELLKRGLDEIRRTIREVEPPRPSTRLNTMPDAQRTTVANDRSTDAMRLRSQLRGDLDWVVMKCLEKDRTRRYETANGLSMDLKRFLHNEPVVARPPSTAYRLKKLARRNKVAFAAGTVVVVALVAGLGTSTWALLREQTARRLAEDRRQEAERARGEERQQRSQAEEAARRAEAGELASRQFAYASDMNLAQQALAANNLGLVRDLLDRNRPKPGQADLRRWEWRHFWQRSRNDFLFSLTPQFDSVLLVSFADTGNLVAFRDIKGAVKLWNPATRHPIAELPGSGYGRALALSYDGNMIALGSTNRDGLPAIALWSVATKSVTGQLESQAFVVSMAISPDGKSLAAFCVDRTVRLWNLETYKFVGAVAANPPDGMHKGVVLFSPDGKSLAIGEADGLIRLLDPATQEEKRRFTAATEGITALAFSPDGKVLASGSGFTDKTVKLWNLADSESAGALVGHNSWVSSLAFSPDGKILASASSDQTIRLWDVAGRQQVSLLRGHLNEIYTLAFSPDGKTLLSGSKDGAVNFWDPTLKRSDATHAILSDAVDRFAFSPDGTLITVNRNGSIALWDSATAQSKAIIPAFGTNNQEVAVSPDGRLLAAGDRSGMVKVCEVTAHRNTTNFIAGAGAILHIRFLNGGRELLTLDTARSVRRWEVGSWRETASWTIDSSAMSIDFSPDERFFVTGHNDGNVRICDASNGAEVARFAGHPRAATGVAFTPDGKAVVTGSDDGLAKLWAPFARREVAVLRGHLLGVHSVAVSPDGQRIATGSNAKEAIKLWDLATHQEVATLDGKGTIFFKTIFSPDGNTLASLNVQGMVHVWHAPSMAEIEATETTNAKSN